MSCQIKAIANLIDPSDVKKCLFGDAVVKFDYVPENELPLQSILISLSSAGDVLAMAWNKNIIVLVAKWDSQERGEVKSKFHTIWNENITNEQNEWITSILCLPLISLGKGGSGPDWTCIAVGFSTGFVRFYTETGSLLMEQHLHNEAVLGIKCQSQSSPRYAGDIELTEEIRVSYNSVICILQGFSLFSTLRACRNHLARVQANCSDKPPMANLIYKKWGFKNQDVTNDCEVIGMTSVNTFDHLMTASSCGGYNAAYRSSAPQHNLIMVTGKRPFIGFHYALEGGSVPVLSDVAIVMANKLASAIGTAVPWFRGSSKVPTSPEKVKGPVSEPAEAMTCRFGLSDVMREGDCIVASPNKMLSVVSDRMGRVTLVDNKRGIAIRTWKGYRNAECGWIEVKEEKDSRSHKSHGKSNIKSTQPYLRTALFLVIYAPKKGIIDIWGIQQGSKITTFSASRNGRLLYTNYGLLGLISGSSHSTANRAQYSCVFMDPLGGLKEITVPFHFALSSKTGKRARDIHLFRKLRTFMREEEFDDEKLINEVTNICLDLKTTEVRLQVVEMLITNKHIIPDALLAALNCFVEKLTQYEDDELEPVAKTLYLMSTQLQRIIEFYKFTRSQFDRPPDYDIVASDEVPSGKHLSSILLVSERDVHRILKLSTTLNELYCSKSKLQVKVTFKEDGRAFLDFLSCFEFGVQGSVDLRKQIPLEKKHQISELIYQGWMYSNDSIISWRDAAKQSNIRPATMMHLALIYWLNNRTDVSLEIELKCFTQLLHAVCSLANVEEVCAECNEISLWWRDVRNTLTESTNPFQALTAAMICRAVVKTVEKKKDNIYSKKFKDDNGNEGEDLKDTNDTEKMEETQDKKANATPEDETYSSMSEWENVSKDTCQFTVLIGNLEDITVLNAVVSQHFPLDHTTTFFTTPFEKIDISLGMILSKGKGSVSEIVAKWLSSSGLDPANLVDTNDVEFDHMEQSIESLKMTSSLDEASAIEPSQQHQIKFPSFPVELGQEAKVDTTSQAYVLENLTLLKRHFPYSLTSSVLLANLCWEFVMSWNKDVTRLEALEAALAVLRQIPMIHMRQGVCCLLWTLHLKKKMEAAAKLLNKLGKLPKDRLCIQDIGLSDMQLVTLLQHCVTFLDIFSESEVLVAESSSVIKCEELWEGHSVGPQPFAALAVSQTPAWYDLLMLHANLANVLHMMAHFNIRINKPLNNLFESVVHPYLFQDITNKVMLTWYRDDKRDSARMEFLCRVITASMDSIHQDTTEGNNLTSKQAILWVSKCQMLASIWKINNDELRIHQVCQLYINGFDQLAEEIQSAVNDTERLGSNLLPIAGRRMMTYLSNSSDLLEQISSISPALLKYLEGLNTSSVVLTNVSNEDTIQLIRRISNYLSEYHRDYYLAELMLDATIIYKSKT